MTTDLRKPQWLEIRDTLAGKCQRVHDALGAHNRFTAKELSVAMGWEVTSVRPRITQLKDAGLVEETGERRNGEHVFRYVSLATAEQRARAMSESMTRGVEPAKQLEKQATLFDY
jgi:transcription initiation factor IIE alpha subunit